MKIYSKETVQHVTASLDECWSFSLSTQPAKDYTYWYGFEITDYDGKSVYPGQVIQWPTFYTKDDGNYSCKENSYFIDEQRFGPYALWHHKHFEATETV
jgi:hypothetical protein